jgi:hypothetical protein
VYPVLFRNAADGGLDRTSGCFGRPHAARWGAVVRGHRLGAPRDRIGFQDQAGNPGLVEVLDPASARRTGGTAKALVVDVPAPREGRLLGAPDRRPKV